MDIVIIIVLVLLGFLSKNWFKLHLNNYDRKILNILWVYHILIAFIFYFYIINFGGDAWKYWHNPKFSTLSFTDFLSGSLGTNFMYVINYFPSKILDLSFLTGSILYAYLGHLGFLCFYVLFKRNIAFNSKFLNINLFPLILFLPNLHFWSAGIGKDTLLFLCIALFLYGMQNPGKHLIKILFALVLSYFLRPHITLFLIMSFGIAFTFAGNIKAYKKTIIIGIFLVGFIIIFNPLMSFLNIEQLDTETLDSYASSSAESLSRDTTGSRVDISGYPFPLKVFTFLYRPLFFDASGILGLVASLENLILLLLSIKFVRLNPIKLFKRADYLFKGMFVFLLIGTTSFSIILGNLGIMLRQKNMFMPALLFIILWGLSYQYHLKTKNKVLPKNK